MVLVGVEAISNVRTDFQPVKDGHYNILKTASLIAFIVGTTGLSYVYSSAACSLLFSEQTKGSVVSDSLPIMFLGLDLSGYLLAVPLQ